jgi:hypothetical protein
MRLPASLAIACLACGDGVRVDEPHVAVSGARLKLEWFLFEDGARQWETGAFYDAELHARCTPRTWIDGATRCAPEAEEALYTDSECTAVIGRGLAIEKPTHFIGYDAIAGERQPSRVYRAGATTAPVASYYEMRDGECEGPLVAPPDGMFYELPGEIGMADLVELRDGEIGDGRVVLRVREAADGLRLPIAHRDRDLRIDCRPTTTGNDASTCIPSDAPVASYFRDAACTEAAIAVAAVSPAPTVAKLIGRDACTSYHAVGAEIEPPLYRRDRGRCVPAVLTSPARVFAVGAVVDLPVLRRTVEEVAGRRLQRVILDDGALRTVHDRLHDTTTRAECRREDVSGVTRCIPGATVPARTLYASRWCATAVRVAEIPQPSCELYDLAIAAGDEEEIDELHLIGSPYEGDPLYQLDALGRCVRHDPPADVVRRALSLALPPDTFLGALRYGER